MNKFYKETMNPRLNSWFPGFLIKYFILCAFVVLTLGCGKDSPPPQDRVGITPPVTPTATAPVIKEIIVYVGRAGTRYHRENCSHLKETKTPITLKKAKEKYMPCERCRPPEKE